MISQLITLANSFVPLSVQTRLRAFVPRRSREVILRKWREAGSSLPPPHELKQSVIEAYQGVHGHRVLVETGTYLGAMVEAQRTNFRSIVSIELSEALWRNAVDRFAPYPHIRIVQGDSGQALDLVVKNLNEDAIFWLDGHYSGGMTARGALDCPIFGEIDALFGHGSRHKHVLLIDDARCFDGTSDYPTLAELEAYVTAKDPRYTMRVADDVIRFTIG